MSEGVDHEVVRPLPTAIFAAALATHLDVHTRRVFAMYNRVRALFAESVVAAVLPGAYVVEDPGAAWDVVWPRSGGTIRIQVKCSGEHVPHFPDVKGPARWNLKEPSFGWDPDLKAKIGPGQHCDVAVLARHEGTEISAGWSFWVLRADKLEGLKAVRPMHVEAKGGVPCTPEHLARTVRRALREV